MQRLALLEAAAQRDRHAGARDVGVTHRAARQAVPLEHGVEAVGELALVALGPAEVLHAPRTAIGRGRHRAPQRDEAWPEAADGLVVAVAVEVDAAADHEPVHERRRASVDAHGEHREVALVGQARQDVALEALPAGRAERGAVGAALPAQAVQLERRRQIREDGLAVGGERVVDVAELAELAFAPAVGAAALRAGVARVGLFPALGHLGHGRLDALHERHAIAGGPGDVALRGQAEDVDGVGPGRRDDRVEEDPAPCRRPRPA